MTTSKVTNLLDLSSGDLSYGARAVSTHFGQNRVIKGNLNELKLQILVNSSRKSMNRNVRLKCIRTAHGKGSGKSQRGETAKEFVVGLRTFYEAVRAALGDPKSLSFFVIDVFPFFSTVTLTSGNLWSV
jgi:hypothetical protein